MKFKKITGILFIMITVTWGCNQSGSVENEGNGNEQDPKEEQVQLPEQQEAPSGEVDKYGRKSGDEHYGHDHPPQEKQQEIQANVQQDDQTNTQQETPSGEVDKYGRKPGDEHYGHDHE